MPNVMVALPNTGGALCSTPQSLADAHYWMPCSNAAKTRNPLKFAGEPQTTGSISAVSRPKFTILWGHVEDISLLNKFFSDCRHVPLLQRYSPTKLCDGAQMEIFGAFLRPAFPVSRVQQVSDLHLKIALRPHTHTMCGSMVDIQFTAAEIRRGKKKEERKMEITGQKYNGLPYYIGRP